LWDSRYRLKDDIKIDLKEKGNGIVNSMLLKKILYSIRGF
jgi:hypothetical protein